MNVILVGEESAGIQTLKTLAIEAADTALSLYAKCTREGVALLVRLLETASRDANSIPLTPQDLTERQYFGKEAPEYGRVNWSRPAREIVNLARACYYYPFPSPWGYPRARLGEQEIGVIKARLTGQPCDAMPGTVGRLDGIAVQVACADEWIWVDRTLVEGTCLSAADILRPGARLDNGI